MLRVFSLDIVWWVITWLHVAAAVIWVGGMFFAQVVLTPPVAKMGIPPHFVRIMGISRFRYFAWSAAATLLVTGIIKAIYTGRIWKPEVLWTTPWGAALVVKSILFLVMAGIAVFITGGIAARMQQKPPSPGGPDRQSPEFLAMQKRMMNFSRANLVLGFAVLGLAVALTRL